MTDFITSQIDWRECLNKTMHIRHCCLVFKNDFFVLYIDDMYRELYSLDYIHHEVTEELLICQVCRKFDRLIRRVTYEIVMEFCPTLMVFLLQCDLMQIFFSILFLIRIYMCFWWLCNYIFTQNHNKMVSRMKHDIKSMLTMNSFSIILVC